MNISLTPELEKLVQSKVASGLYNSASEVIRESLRLLHERDKIRELRLQELRAEIRKGVEQLEQGEYTIYETDELETLVSDVQQQGRTRTSQPKAD
ncbi:MAG: type II toxin-antitoxin system ParD family antitoxin [Xenococcus sp. (in: cyanobacteria)]